LKALTNLNFEGLYDYLSTRILFIPYKTNTIGYYFVLDNVVRPNNIDAPGQDFMQPHGAKSQHASAITAALVPQIPNLPDRLLR
jgi:hypothetical protein